MLHIWTIEDWEKNIDLDRKGHKTGLRLRFDKDVNPDVKETLKEFAYFLRKEYYFPLRVNVYVRSRYRIKAMDGDMCCGTFWYMPDDYTINPYVRIATGDYEDMCANLGEEYAMYNILYTLAHELTHYFQYINSLKLTPRGMERQANNYAYFILEEYEDVMNR